MKSTQLSPCRSFSLSARNALVLITILGAQVAEAVIPLDLNSTGQWTDMSTAPIRC
jgi:hypothetical protein